VQGLAGTLGPAVSASTRQAAAKAPERLGAGRAARLTGFHAVLTGKGALAVGRREKFPPDHGGERLVERE